MKGWKGNSKTDQASVATPFPRTPLSTKLVKDSVLHTLLHKRKHELCTSTQKSPPPPTKFLCYCSRSPTCYSCPSGCGLDPCQPYPSPDRLGGKGRKFLHREKYARYATFCLKMFWNVLTNASPAMGQPGNMNSTSISVRFLLQAVPSAVCRYSFIPLTERSSATSKVTCILVNIGEPAPQLPSKQKNQDIDPIPYDFFS